jgi:hypothetical protein
MLYFSRLPIQLQLKLKMKKLFCLWLFIAITLCVHAQTASIEPVPSPTEKNCNCDQLNRDRRNNKLDLGKHKWQNLLRDNFKITQEFEKKLLENFFWKCGQYQCSEKEFFDIASYAALQWDAVTDSITFTRNGQTFIGKRINFYGSETLDCALGSAWMIVNEQKMAVGFYDHYNFNKASFFGKHRRPLIHEFATRFVRFFRKHTEDFIVYYGVVPDDIARQLSPNNHLANTINAKPY